jgi:dTDP-4-dehydrorhamnose reductase
MKILLLGASGQLGWQLRRSLAPLGEVIALSREAGGDLLRRSALEAAVADVAPEVVVNAAAYTAVDRAESEPDAAFAVNAEACAVLGRASSRAGAWLVHYSTDYVFDGSGEQPWREDAATAPLNVYGRSKLAGEEALRAAHSRHLILRTCWVHDTWGSNFVKTILRAAQQQDALRVVDDQWGAPTRAALVADVTAHLLRAVAPAQAGTYHLAAAGEANWNQVARCAIAAASAAGLELRAGPDAVVPVPSSEVPRPAARPANSRLDTSRLRRTFGVHLPPWQDGVQAVATELARAWRSE